MSTTLPSTATRPRKATARRVAQSYAVFTAILASVGGAVLNAFTGAFSDEVSFTLSILILAIGTYVLSAKRFYNLMTRDVPKDMWGELLYHGDKVWIVINDEPAYVGRVVTSGMRRDGMVLVNVQNWIEEQYENEVWYDPCD